MKFVAFVLCLAAIAAVGTPAMAQNCVNTEDARPIQLGVSGGNLKCATRRCCTSGTLGALVQDGAGVQYILSNNHVLARTRSGKRKRALGEPIVQPGLIDANPQCSQNPESEVASLSGWVPLRFGRKNVADAAIAQVTSGDVDTTGTIKNIGPISSTIVPSSSVTLDMAVQKMGRTTCLTTGSVIALDARLRVRYPRICGLVSGGVAVFVNQIIIGGNFSAPGDSGSLVVTTDSCPRAVGLLFADGTDQQGNPITVINPIDQVLSALNVSMVGGCSPPAAGTTVAQNNSGAAGPQSSAAPSQSAEFRAAMVQARAVKQRHESELMAIAGVLGVGIGRGGNSMPVIVVFVRNDDPQVASKVPSQLEGVTVETRPTGEFKAL